jgi:MFS family permease
MIDFSLSAILSDVTSQATRSKALAHVGIAFAICFCIGPPIGAYFASRPPPPALKQWGIELNIYAIPAALTLVLLVAETAFLIVALPETRKTGGKRGTNEVSSKTNPRSYKLDATTRLKVLKSLRKFHFQFLALFSGIEYTLTFLTFDRKSFLVNN